jgi:ornithine cyclodeaminase/alanine dehydrogenase-like protein (mu-crystallin family)
VSSERSIAIFSPGLLGGSLVKTILQRMPGVEVRVWARREEAVEEVRREFPSVIASTSVEDSIRGASLAVLCLFFAGRCPPDGH